MRRFCLAVFVCVLVFMPLGSWAAGPARPSAEQVSAWAEQAIAVRVQTQKQVDEFAQAEAGLLDEQERLQEEIKRLSRSRKKTEAYLKDQLAKIAEIERQLQEVGKIRDGLEPILDDSLARLKADSENKLPFAARERQKRLALLARNLSDYDLSLAQKTKRLFTALAMEARNGDGVEVAEGEISVEGRTISVRKIRLGEIALFAVDQGKEHAWRWDASKGGYQSLAGWAGDIAKLADIAQRKRLVALVEVPLGRKAEAGGAK